MNNECVFCKIINKQLPGYVISENEKVIVFLSLENHPLVVPKKHYANIYDLEEGMGNEIMKELIKTSKTVKKVFHCDGVYITQANEMAAGQDVFHLHFHVYPKWVNEKMNKVSVRSDKEKIETLEKFKKFIC